MLKIEDIVVPSKDQMIAVIYGMRNPLNSWSRSDSNSDEHFILGKNDEDLMSRLTKAGAEHRKFMRMMPVYMTVTAPLYWWKEADTYKLGTVSNSCSTMHKIQAKEFVRSDFSIEHLTPKSLECLDSTIHILNSYREDYIDASSDTYNKKDIWWQMIQLLPSSYNQKRTIMMNYEVLRNIYHQRQGHKLDEWQEFCRIVSEIDYGFLIKQEN